MRFPEFIKNITSEYMPDDLVQNLHFFNAFGHLHCLRTIFHHNPFKRARIHKKVNVSRLRRIKFGNKPRQVHPCLRGAVDKIYFRDHIRHSHS